MNICYKNVNFSLASVTSADLIPPAQTIGNGDAYDVSQYKCPDGLTSFKLGNTPDMTGFMTGFYSCSCEDHCRWDRCRLDNPPTDCLSKIDAKWMRDLCRFDAHKHLPYCLSKVVAKWIWDPAKDYWIAQFVEGIYT